jgi:Tfp pilus assembly protein PilV
MRQSGFSIVEAVIAMALLMSSVMSLAQVVFQSARTTTLSGGRTLAVLLAADKMEQLRALAWTVDAAGLPVADAGLAASPSDALDRDLAAYADRIGTWNRRWSIHPLETMPDALVIQVRVVGVRGEEGRLVTVRTRRAN